jgi:hypothetical protein
MRDLYQNEVIQRKKQMTLGRHKTVGRETEQRGALRALACGGKFNRADRAGPNCMKEGKV